MGSPLDPKTWSATPFNISSELKKANKLGDHYDISFSKKSSFFTFLTKASSALYYQNSKEITRGLLLKYYRSNKLAKLVGNKSHTLHFGTAATPFFSKHLLNQKHYLYTDSTWNIWSNQSLEMDGVKKRLRNDAELLEAKSYQQFSHIFSVSEHVRRNLIEHYQISPSKITVVGTGRGILSPYFGAKDYSNQKILFTAKGRFTGKGGDLVLQAFEKVVQKNRDAQLTIVGQDNYAKEISHPNITVLGFIPLEELQELFNTHSLFIMPALNEPWGLVYIEALACKTPIIGLSKNAFPEISANGKYGYSLEAPDPDKLAELINRAISAPLELEQKGLAGQKYCLTKYTWENVAKRIIETIEQNHLDL